MRGLGAEEAAVAVKTERIIKEPWETTSRLFLKKRKRSDRPVYVGVLTHSAFGVARNNRRLVVVVVVVAILPRVSLPVPVSIECTGSKRRRRYGACYGVR